MAKTRPKKVRADQLVVAQGLCREVDEAKRHIMAGNVRIGSDYVVKNSSELIPITTELTLKLPCPYVSRGAYKLIPALDAHLKNLRELVALDVGASTGGFTDLMLQRGASKVYTIDVGRGQLHQKLRQDPRVVCHEQVNARHLDVNFIPEKVDLMTMDVSFISVKKVLPTVNVFLKNGGLAFILIKPQFEAQKNEIMQGGVVRDESIRQKYVENIVSFAIDELFWECLEVIPSPIKGPKGNQEYLSIFKKCAEIS